jgi:hypothetical protein
MFAKSHKHKESREVPLNDINTISLNMTQSIDNMQSEIRPIEDLYNFNEHNLMNTAMNSIILRAPLEIVKKNETSDNNDRKELLWTSNIEDVIKSWYSQCLVFANTHRIRGRYHKKVFYTLGILSACIPMTLAAIGDILDGDLKWISIVLLIITGILNIVNGYLNPGKKSERHFIFESDYSSLAVEITSELVKPQAYRQDADVYLQRILDRYNHLNSLAPST